MVSTSTSLPRAATPSRLELLPPAVPRCLHRGREVSVYYHVHGPSVWPRQQRPQLEIAFFFKAAACRFSWLGPKDNWCEREVEGRHISVIAPNLPHECHLEGNTEMLVLYVEPELVRRATRRKISGIVVAEEAEQEVVPWMLASLLRHVCSRPPRPDARTIDAVGGELACWLLGLLQSHNTSTHAPGRCLTPAQQGKVLRYIQDNLKYDIHVIDLAKQTGHSPSHFTELFVNTMGRAPYRYLKEVRVMRAYELLLTGDYLMREAAEEVGYSNPDHFSEVFQQFSGLSVRDLLKRVHTGSANLTV